MKRLVAMALTGMMALSPITVLADDADLEARVAALEERVASLETQLNIPEIAEMESEEATEKTFDLYFEDEDCILSYDGYETVHDTQGKPAIITYFYFTNNSDETKTAIAAFSVKVFQHGKEMSPAYISQHIQEESDSFAQVMPGADPIRVAFVLKLDDMSDVIVRVGPLFDFGGDKHLDIPLTIKSGKEPEEKTEKKPEESMKSDESAPPFDDLNLLFHDHMDNDVTGKWRVTITSTPHPVSDYIEYYYKTYVKPDDTVHVIVNFTLKTTTLIRYINAGFPYFEIATYEYVDGDERDAKQCPGGISYGSQIVFTDTWEVQNWDEYWDSLDSDK